MVDKSRFTKTAAGTIDVTQEQRPSPPSINEHDLDDAFSAWDEHDAGARKSARPPQLAEATSSTTAKTRIGRKALAADSSRDDAPPAGAMATGTSNGAAPSGVVPSRMAPSRVPPSGPAPRSVPSSSVPPSSAAPRSVPSSSVPPISVPSSSVPPSSAAPSDVVPLRERAAFPAADPITEPAFKLFDPVSMNDIVLSRARTIDDPLTTRLLAEISRTDHDRAARARSEITFLPTAGIVDRTREAAPTELSDLIVTDPEPTKTVEDRQLGPDDELRARRPTTRRMMVRPKDEPFRKK